MLVARDFMGRVICVGDILVYPVRKRSDMRLKKLTVQRLVERKENGTTVCYIVGENEAGRRVNLFKSERSVIVEMV